jgi:hypothetical protein
MKKNRLLLFLAIAGPGLGPLADAQAAQKADQPSGQPEAQAETKPQEGVGASVPGQEAVAEGQLIYSQSIYPQSSQPQPKSLMGEALLGEALSVPGQQPSAPLAQGHSSSNIGAQEEEKSSTPINLEPTSVSQPVPQTQEESKTRVHKQKEYTLYLVLKQNGKIHFANRNSAEIPGEQYFRCSLVIKPSEAKPTGPNDNMFQCVNANPKWQSGKAIFQGIAQLNETVEKKWGKSLSPATVYLAIKLHKLGSTKIGFWTKKEIEEFLHLFGPINADSQESWRGENFSVRSMEFFLRNQKDLERPALTFRGYLKLDQPDPTESTYITTIRKRFYLDKQEPLGFQFLSKISQIGEYISIAYLKILNDYKLNDNMISFINSLPFWFEKENKNRKKDLKNPLILEGLKEAYQTIGEMLGHIYKEAGSLERITALKSFLSGIDPEAQVTKKIRDRASQALESAKNIQKILIEIKQLIDELIADEVPQGKICSLIGASARIRIARLVFPNSEHKSPQDYHDEHNRFKSGVLDETPTADKPDGHFVRMDLFSKILTAPCEAGDEDKMERRAQNTYALAYKADQMYRDLRFLSASNSSGLGALAVNHKGGLVDCGLMKFFDHVADVLDQGHQISMQSKIKIENDSFFDFSEDGSQNTQPYNDEEGIFRKAAESYLVSEQPFSWAH